MDRPPFSRIEENLKKPSQYSESLGDQSKFFIPKKFSTQKNYEFKSENTDAFSSLNMEELPDIDAHPNQTLY